MPGKGRCRVWGSSPRRQARRRPVHSRKVEIETITWADFEKVDLRVGRVLSAEVFAEAGKPAYILHVDSGPDIGTRKPSAQLTEHYEAEELVGRLVMGVVNFPKKQIGPLMSECLVTRFSAVMMQLGLLS